MKCTASETEHAALRLGTLLTCSPCSRLCQTRLDLAFHSGLAPETQTYASPETLVETLVAAGSELGNGPLDEQTRSERTAVRDARSLDCLERFIELWTGEEAERKDSLWKKGQVMLASKSLSDVKPSAAICEQAIDFHKRRTEKLESAQLNSAGVHPFVWGHVTRSKEVADRWEVAAEKLIEARYAFANNPSDENRQIHNSRSEEYMKLEEEERSLASNVATLRYLLEEGLILAPFEQIQEAATNKAGGRVSKERQ